MRTNKYFIRFLALLILSIILLSYAFYSINQTNSDWGHYLHVTWALGIVVPNGAKLEDGSIVKWSEIRNITAIIRLPNITRTDGMIYVVLSAMTASKTILQVAAGISPNNTYWLTYAMIALNISSGTNYIWRAENSLPIMDVHHIVSISIYSLKNNQGRYEWNYTVHDITTGEFSSGFLADDNSYTFMDGDQEVIALESYTKKESIFSYMGNVTLYALLLNGKKVISGWYIYDGWDWTKHPLFVVGGSTPSPQYISISSNNGTIYWKYGPISWSTSTIKIGY
jgi:hypothetical protein